MKRGDVVTVALPGDFGKPRPAIVVQSDLFNKTHQSVTLLPLTSTLVDAPLFRMIINPGKKNGLAKVSQVMVDKVMTVRRDRVGKPVGRLDADEMLRVSRTLALWLGIA